MDTLPTFQLVGNLKQSRPGVKNPLVKLKAFDDKTVGVVTSLKEYLTSIHTLRGSESQLFVSYQRPFRLVSRATIRWVKCVPTDSGIDTSRFKPQSTRAAITSAANSASVSLDDTSHTAGWTSDFTLQSIITSLLLKIECLLIRSKRYSAP